jgi:hypothetical protein
VTEKTACSEAELAARRPVWIALSELFLDTDVRIWYPGILRALAASPYTEEQLRAILDHEVAPVLESNLLAVAGEWAAFDEDWLVAEAAKRRGKRRWMPALVNLDEDWRALAMLLRTLRALPESERRKRLEGWDALLPLFLDRDPRHREAADGFTLAEWEALFRLDLWPALVPQAREQNREDAGAYPSEAEILANWQRFRERRPPDTEAGGQPNGT